MRVPAAMSMQAGAPRCSLGAGGAARKRRRFVWSWRYALIVRAAWALFLVAAVCLVQGACGGSGTSSVHDAGQDADSGFDTSSGGESDSGAGLDAVGPDVASVCPSTMPPATDPCTAPNGNCTPSCIYAGGITCQCCFSKWTCFGPSAGSSTSSGGNGSGDANTGDAPMDSMASGDGSSE